MVESVHYCGGIPSVYSRIFSAVRGYNQHCRGEHKYCGGYSLMWRESRVLKLEYLLNKNKNPTYHVQ